MPEEMKIPVGFGDADGMFAPSNYVLKTRVRKAEVRSSWDWSQWDAEAEKFVGGLTPAERAGVVSVSAEWLERAIAGKDDKLSNQIPETIRLMLLVRPESSFTIPLALRATRGRDVQTLANSLSSIVNVANRDLPDHAAIIVGYFREAMGHPLYGSKRAFEAGVSRIGSIGLEALYLPHFLAEMLVHCGKSAGDARKELERWEMFAEFGQTRAHFPLEYQIVAQQALVAVTGQ